MTRKYKVEKLMAYVKLTNRRTGKLKRLSYGHFKLSRAGCSGYPKYVLEEVLGKESQ